MSTIAAISTAPGIGGIGIIRMSGKECFSILEKIFVPINKTQREIKGYTIKYGHIIEPKTKEKIDEVLVSYFKAPKSYTVEDMCEINSHGSTIIVQRILELCLENGAIIAEPGEFTKRAFLNGRIDLSQAESVIDIINAKTEKESKVAMKQLDGFLSKEIQKIRKKLLSLMADIEATIDYPEYDIGEVTNNKILNELKQVKKELEQLEKSFENGKIIKDGIKMAIIGKPNVGKSSLMNALLKEERAIVTEYEGTTRDTIEEFIQIEGIPFKLIDTAGIRKASDEVEKIGIHKAKEIAKECDLIIAMFDAHRELDEEDKEIIDIIRDKNAILVWNKIDLIPNMESEFKSIILDKPNINISAKNKKGIEKLYQTIAEMYKINEITVDNAALVTNVRHKNSIQRAEQSLKRAINCIEENTPIDMISIYIKEILENLGEITGENVTEDIIKEIFSKFCLGK